MNEISQMMLYGAFGSSRIGQTTSKGAGIKDADFKKNDTDKDGYLSLSEILENDDICAKLLARINQIEGVLLNTENEEAKLKKEKAGEKNLLKEDTSNFPEFEGFNVRERKLVLQA